MQRLLLPLTIFLGVAACGPPPAPRTPRASDFRTLSETRGLELIDEALTDAGVQATANFTVDIGGGHTLDADRRLAAGSFAIEWISPQDRADLGDLLPGPAPGGQLRIAPGAGDQGDVQVLLLEHDTYRYDPDRHRVERGAPSIREAESRVRRDIRDFVEYVRGQGGL
jgi:hypothetical protein